MLTVLLAWIFQLFVFISFGDILLNVYNAVTKNNERYSLLNLFLLGIPSLLIVLSLLHFIIPINSCVLFILCLIGTIYWVLNKSRFLSLLRQVLNDFKVFSKSQFGIFLLFILSILFITSWGVLNYDSACYHYQSLRWIEEFSTVVGLGNVEERLGFNSNYFILSAPFSMRFLLNEPLFALQGLLVVLMFAWVLQEIVESSYSFNTCLLLFLHLIMIAINIIHFSDSSTDVLPNQLVFYLISYLVLYPKKMKTDRLLLVTIPIVILTLKLSLAVFSLLPLIVLVQAFRLKQYRSILFTLAICFLIGILWLVRNVILSGYLIFPMYEIDFFSFDWKVPAEVAIAERNFIKSGAIWQFKNLYNNALTFFYAPQWHFIHTYIITFLYSVIILFTPFLFYLKKKKKIENDIFFLYLIVFLSVIASYISAPDFRFSYGLIFGLVLMSGLVFSHYTKFKFSLPIKKDIFFIGSLILLTHLFVTFWQVSSGKTSDWKFIALKPRQYSQKQLVSKLLAHKRIKINNNVDLYISNSVSGFTMYKLPAVPDDVDDPVGWRFQHYENLEARGTSLQDGFKTKQ